MTRISEENNSFFKIAFFSRSGGGDVRLAP